MVAAASVLANLFYHSFILPFKKLRTEIEGNYLQI
jgi:hypothetical protein